MPTFVEDKPMTALEKVLSSLKNVEEGSMTEKIKNKIKFINPPQEKKEETKSIPKIKKTKKPKKTEITTPLEEILTREGAKKKREEVHDESFIPVEIWYYFNWKCPSCKKHNIQPYKNIFEIYGPAWSATGVTCDKCKKHFKILEDFDEAN